ncbi:hypothetical protein D3C83_81580 [compost metagenome]
MAGPSAGSRGRPLRPSLPQNLRYAAFTGSLFRDFRLRSMSGASPSMMTAVVATMIKVNVRQVASSMPARDSTHRWRSML